MMSTTKHLWKIGSVKYFMIIMGINYKALMSRSIKLEKILWH